MSDASGSASARRRRLVRSGHLTKWAVFGVVLPLLPIAGHIAAAWFAADTRQLGFVSLFGDGELLVLATVVSAAAFGDLAFDLYSNGSRRYEYRFRVAVVSALALAIVVLSVLLFGLVSYQTEARRTTLAAAQTDFVRGQSQNLAWLRLAQEQSAEAASLQKEVNRLTTRIQKLDASLQGEVDGTSGSRVPGFGPFAEELKSTISLLDSQRAKALAEATFLRNEASRVLEVAVERVQQLVGGGKPWAQARRDRIRDHVRLVVDLGSGGGFLANRGRRDAAR